MRYSWIYMLTALVVCVCFESIVSAQDLAQDLTRAIHQLDESVRLLESGDELSITSLQQSSAMIEQVISNYDFRSPGVYLALGNAYMLEGRTGHAVLAYRRGEQLMPTHVELRHSLKVAQSSVLTDVSTSRSNRIWNIALSWRGIVSLDELSVVFLVFFTLGWLLLGLAYWGRCALFVPRIGIVLIVLSMLPLLMYGLEWYRSYTLKAGVITQVNAYAWSGPDEGVYELVYDEPLSPGTELSLVKERDGWGLIELSDGSRCWLESHQFSLVSR